MNENIELCCNNYRKDLENEAIYSFFSITNLPVWIFLFALLIVGISPVILSLFYGVRLLLLIPVSFCLSGLGLYAVIKIEEKMENRRKYY